MDLRADIVKLDWLASTMTVEPFDISQEVQEGIPPPDSPEDNPAPTQSGPSHVTIPNIPYAPNLKGACFGTRNS